MQLLFFFAERLRFSFRTFFWKKKHIIYWPFRCATKCPPSSNLLNKLRIIEKDLWKDIKSSMINSFLKINKCMYNIKMASQNWPAKGRAAPHLTATFVIYTLSFKQSKKIYYSARKYSETAAHGYKQMFFFETTNFW